MRKMTKNLLVGGVVAAFAATAMGAATPYSGGWTQTWDFNGGTQGWTLNGSAAHNAVGANGTGTIYAPDTSNAFLDVTALGIGGRTPTPSATWKPFVLQVDAYVGASNYLQGSGVAAVRSSDGKGVWGTGTAAGNQGISGNDKSWYNTTKNKSFGLAVGQWTTIQIDYGVSTPGKFTVWYTATPGNAAGWPAGDWKDVINDGHNADIHPNQQFDRLMLGGGINGAQTGWSQAQFDNVKIYIAPEPTTVGLLVIGGLFLARRRRTA